MQTRVRKCKITAQKKRSRDTQQNKQRDIEDEAAEEEESERLIQFVVVVIAIAEAFNSIGYGITAYIQWH